MSKQLEQEILKIREDMEELANKNMKPLLESYKNLLDDIRVEIAKLYMQYGKLEEMSKQDRYKGLKRLEKILLNIAQELGLMDVKKTSTILKKAYKESYYRTHFTIQRGVEAEISLAILSANFIKEVIENPVDGKLFSDRIWDNKQKLVNRVIRDVEKAMIQGTSIDKLAREIKKDFGSSAYESKRLIYTEVARCQSQAQSQIYKESGIVNKIMWSATLDRLTNPEDAKLDGKMWDIDEDHPSPPLHPNCRCCLIPVVPGWNPTKRRENIKDNSGKKPIIDYTDYNSWKQSKNIS